MDELDAQAAGSDILIVDRSDEYRERKAAGHAQRGVREIYAQHVERAVREVDYAEHAENQRQARRDQECRAPARELPIGEHLVRAARMQLSLRSSCED